MNVRFCWCYESFFFFSLKESPDNQFQLVTNPLQAAPNPSQTGYKQSQPIRKPATSCFTLTHQLYAAPVHHKAGHRPPPGPSTPVTDHLQRPPTPSPTHCTPAHGRSDATNPFAHLPQAHCVEGETLEYLLPQDWQRLVPYVGPRVFIMRQIRLAAGAQPLSPQLTGTRRPPPGPSFASIAADVLRSPRSAATLKGRTASMPARSPSQSPNMSPRRSVSPAVAIRLSPASPEQCGESPEQCGESGPEPCGDSGKWDDFGEVIKVPSFHSWEG